MYSCKKKVRRGVVDIFLSVINPSRNASSTQAKLTDLQGEIIDKQRKILIVG